MIDSHQVEGRQTCAFEGSLCLPRIDSVAGRASRPEGNFPARSPTHATGHLLTFEVAGRTAGSDWTWTFEAGSLAVATVMSSHSASGATSGSGTSASGHFEVLNFGGLDPWQ